MSGDEAEALAGRRVLITGATGFLGRHLVRALVATGGQPHLLLRPEAVSQLGTGPCHAHPADLGDASALRQVVRTVEPDIILHLGGYTDPARDPGRATQALRVNLEATAALAAAALETGSCTSFVATGTAEEYGRQPAPFHEDMPLQPLSPYSASKAAATLWLRMMHDTHGLPAVVVRPFLVYGPGQAPPKLVPSAVLAAVAGADFSMTHGLQMRELTHVNDVVRGILAAALTPAVRGEVVNLGSGDERPVIEIVRQIYALAGGSGRPLPGARPTRSNDMPRFVADTSKAASLLGWRASIPLEQGLAETIAWARAHGDWPVPLTTATAS